MLAALWVSKTGLGAQDVALTTISNNLANVSTIGFKRDRPVFQDLLYQIDRQPGAQASQETQLPSGLQLGTGVRASGTQKVFTNGSLQVTDNALDVAINGRGFLQITMPDGTIGYSRDGQFHLDANGQIVTGNGDPLQPALTSGAPQQGTPGLNGLGSIEQGSLENSNVSVVEELVNMISTQRAYEMNSKVVSTADQMLQYLGQNI